MRYLSVCSGVEAATVAWHPLGWEAVGYSEIEKFPSAVLAHHYPNTPNFGDMTKYKEWNTNGTVELLVGGTPCQSFSVAGLRKGLEDPRGNLALVYCGILDHFRPKWFVWENVPGVLSSNGGRDFGSFLGALAQLGYGFSYRVLDAQYFGVPQRRRRVFVVGHLGDWMPAAKVLFERESLQRNLKTIGGKREGSATRIEARSPNGSPTIGSLMARDHKGFGNQDMSDGRGLILEPKVYENHPADSRVKEMGDVCATVTSRWGTGGGNVPFVQSYGIPGNWIGRKPENGGNATTPMNDLAPCLTKTDRHGVAYGFTQCDAARDIGDQVSPTLRSGGSGGYPNHAVAHGFNVNARPDELKLEEEATSSLTCSQKPGVMMDMAVRRLTPVECERLQGFPDEYTNIPWRGKDESPDGPRYKAMGNSMAVPVMAWIGKRIQEVENEQSN